MDKYDLHDWNCRLVEAIFFDRVTSSPEIRRIDATDSFLAHVGGFDDVTAARKSFLDAMPHTEHGVRLLFDPSVMDNWTPANDDLPFYAQLHLTILAASGEESLQDVGEFRVRLAQMLGLEPKDYVSRTHLPALWQYAQQWSANRAKRLGDTRQLILPDPGNETIIGYSKRLAFPSFRDQNHLAELFTRTGEDASSPLFRLLKILRSNLEDFSDRFREEFNRFSRILESGDATMAAETPFWDAIVETTWSRAQQSVQRVNAGCRIEIDPNDPYDPGLWLYCRDVMDHVPELSRSTDDRLENGLVGWNCHENGEPGKIVEVIRSQWRRNRYRSWLGDRLGRALNDGCVGFARDDQGRWFDVFSPPSSGYIWLILHRDRSWLCDAPKNLGKPIARYCAPLAGSSSWMLFGPIEMNEKLRAWLDARLFLPDFFAKRLTRPIISVVGTVRREDGGYLYLPPMVPTFRCQGAQSGIATVDCEGRRLSYKLELFEDGLVLPEIANDDLGHEFTMRLVTIDGKGRELAYGRYRFFDTSSSLGYKSVRNPSNWLESNVQGNLCTYSSSPFFETTNVKEYASSKKGDICPLTESTLPSYLPIQMEPGDLDVRWTSTTEILSAIFTRRYAFSLGESLDLLGLIWGTRQDAWVRLNDLVQNGVLRLLHTRHWSTSVLVANHPFIVVHPNEDGVIVRIGGLLSSAMRSTVDQLLGQRCIALSSPDGSIAGALEYHLDDVAGLTTLQFSTEWKMVYVDKLPVLKLPRFEDLFTGSVRQDLDGFTEEGKVTWSARLGRFVECKSVEVVLPRLERWRVERQQDLYVLFRKDGSMWNTDCRTWALLGFAAESRRSFGHFSRGGAVMLEDPSLALPIPLAWYTVIAGGGVCFRQSNGTRVYPAGISWSPADACDYWKEYSTRSIGRVLFRGAARERYKLLLERERMKVRIG
ncbi:MAG: hypothetical protein AB2784_08260 [Candidatus Thiodiazotropha endolucinida]